MSDPTLTADAATPPAPGFGAEARGLLSLGLPIVGSNIAQVAIATTDSVMLGWHGVESLAAATLAQSTYFTVFIIGTAIAYAVMPMVARLAEQGDWVHVRRVTRMGFWLSFALGLLVVPALVSLEPLFRLLGQQEELIPLADDYMDIVAFSIFPALGVVVLRNYLAALERTGFALLVALGALAVNASLNYVLIFGNFGAPEMGVRGAATATLITATLTFAVLALYASRTFPDHKLFHRLWRPDFDALRQLLRLALPIGVAHFAEVGFFAASAYFIGWFGAVPLAAHGIALRLAELTFVVHMGISSAGTVRVGRALGRGDRPGLRATGKAAQLLSLAIAAVAVSAFLLFPETLAGLFLSPDDPRRDAILPVATGLLLIAAVFQTFDGQQVVSIGLLRGLHDTRAPMVYAAFSYWLIGMPASYVLGFVLGFGPAGVWWGLVAGLVSASVLLLLRFWRLA